MPAVRLLCIAIGLIVAGFVGIGGGESPTSQTGSTAAAGKWGETLIEGHAGYVILDVRPGGAYPGESSP